MGQAGEDARLLTLLNSTQLYVYMRGALLFGGLTISESFYKDPLNGWEQGVVLSGHNCCWLYTYTIPAQAVFLLIDRARSVFSLLYLHTATITNCARLWSNDFRQLYIIITKKRVHKNHKRE